MQTIYSNLIKELHAYAKKYQFQRAVIGLSGGLDSSVAFVIAVKAFGPQNVTALIIPEVGLTPNEDIDHAKMLASHFKVCQHYQPLNNFLVDFNFVTWDKSLEATIKLKAQMRSAIIAHYANSKNALFIGTANKSDLRLGYGSKDGEFAGDVQLLGDLFKTEIFELAKAMELPPEILDKTPSRWLKPNHSDEEELASPWSKIDDIIKKLDKGTDPQTMIEKGMDALTVHKVVRMIQQNERKLDPAHIFPAGQIGEAIKKARAAEEASSIKQ